MTEGNGRPIVYKVDYSTNIKERIKALHLQAASKGKGHQFINALRAILSRLDRTVHLPPQNDPEQPEHDASYPDLGEHTASLGHRFRPRNSNGCREGHRQCGDARVDPGALLELVVELLCAVVPLQRERRRDLCGSVTLVECADVKHDREGGRPRYPWPIPTRKE